MLLHGVAGRRQGSFGCHRERGRIDDGHGGGIIEERQVAHLVTHRPPLCRGGEAPRGLVQRLEQSLEIGVLGLEVGEQSGQRGGFGGHGPGGYKSASGRRSPNFWHRQ